MKSKSSRSATLGITLALAAAGSAAAHPATNPLASASASPLQEAKDATAKYRSVKRAREDGYVREGGCVSSPAGAMGIHYVNQRLAGDPKIHAKRPEILLYARTDGKLRLVGIEYWRAAADQEPPVDNSDVPRLFGRAFDGPMEGHAPGMPHHYDLHVWLWSANPDGKFAPFNPRLRCPA